MKLVEDMIFFILFFSGIVCLEFPLNILNNVESKNGILMGMINMYVCFAFLIGYLMIIFSWLIIMFFNGLVYFINYIYDFFFF